MRLLLVVQSFFEALGFYIIVLIFSLLPRKAAADFGGWMCRTLGMMLPLAKIAEKNLLNVMPQMSAQERKQTAREVFDNFGRLAAEYCHIHDIKMSDIAVSGTEVLKNLRPPVIFFSAHMANFQIVPIVGQNVGFPMMQFYRNARNKLVDYGMRKLQGHAAEGVLAKGSGGTKELLKSMLAKKNIFLLLDHKFRGGKPVPFLGHSAMTAVAVVGLCRKFACPLVPVRVVRRENKEHFLLEFCDPVEILEDDVETMENVNAIIGSWILQNPGQWMWLHKRWQFDY